MACRTLCTTVHRKRVFTPDQLDGGNLRRCLNRWDLTSLGVGSTLGIGVYLLLGYVALNLAGPSVVLSFLVAAVAASFAGLCYAEFASRIPRAGSAYIYIYVSMGELAAFIVGWNNILEGIFGTASLARGLSMFVDSTVNNTMSEWFTTFAPIGTTPFSQYFDFFAFFLVLILGALLVFGARESAVANNVFTIINLIIILFIIIGGAVNSSIENWFIPEIYLPEEYGMGGFFPYGVVGTMKGAAICFYAFVGFDTISSTAEEAQDSRKSIPMAILITLGSLFCIYASVAIVVTTMVPYYRTQGIHIAFTNVGWEWAKWVIYVGIICGICASLIGALYPLPRLLYAMSSDGLFLHWFSKVTKQRQSPVIATIVPTTLIAVLAGILEINQLLLMMCIGTLLSYTLVAISVIVLRYRSNDIPYLYQSYPKQIFGCRMPPSKMSTRIIYVTLALYILLCIVIAFVAAFAENIAIAMGVLHAIALFIIIIMALQPKVKEEIYFKTPLVPLIPCISIYINIQLMALITAQTWIRVAVWTIIGIFIYMLCLYVYKRNKSNYLQDNMSTYPHLDKNGKTAVQIVVQSPTPPSTVRDEERNDSIQVDNRHELVIHPIEVKDDTEMKIEENIIQQAIIETNDEKEAKIIDLLDQVLQAEEDSYGEITSLKDDNIEPKEVIQMTKQRKSLSELSDAGSDASLGNQVLSKYDVIAQVHREDLTIVSEEDEKNYKEDVNLEKPLNEQEGRLNDTNDSETNSRTDESGYSDTFDKTVLNDSTEDVKDVRPYIPVPPPFDEKYFAKTNPKKFYSMPKSTINPVEDSLESEKDMKPRESVQSNNSNAEDSMVFGSEKQIDFISKLTNIFQNKINTEHEEHEQRKRSHSIGNADETLDSATSNRPLIFEDLKKEIIANKGKNLRPTNLIDTSAQTDNEPQNEEDNSSMSRQDLKSKLESIFANGGTQLVKPRLMKSNPPTPEDAYQTESSSNDSINKNVKVDKNDTLKRQKAKFSVVLNSFRQSFNTDDQV
ncbi:cationic amino acid transporter 3-like [Achroia grisella]|uniref:cationic amino acid transporter 3-like n=1 Tax=Achroia grisella TaxID=688607 RepID=UPI0027D2CB09|nr:cationic amino acid transporter 3-like [Achroia grisella]